MHGRSMHPNLPATSLMHGRSPSTPSVLRKEGLQSHALLQQCGEWQKLFKGKNHHSAKIQRLHLLRHPKPIDKLGCIEAWHEHQARANTSTGKGCAITLITKCCLGASIRSGSKSRNRLPCISPATFTKSCCCLTEAKGLNQPRESPPTKAKLRLPTFAHLSGMPRRIWFEHPTLDGQAQLSFAQSSPGTLIPTAPRA